MEYFEKSNKGKAHGKPLGDENSEIPARCQSSFSIILSLNSMNSLNWVYSDVSSKKAGHHKVKCKVLK